jgi:hypothetical protein
MQSLAGRKLGRFNERQAIPGALSMDFAAVRRTRRQRRR